MSAAAPALGRRERSKFEKLARIKRAARELFVSQGFDATTTKQIAERADIGTGTLFLYARDKRDLVFLIFLEAVQEVTERAIAHAPRDAPLLDRLVAVFAGFFERYAREPELARLFVTELVFIEGESAETHDLLLARFFAGIGTILDDGIRRGEVDPEIDVRGAVENLFALYLATLAAWMRDDTLRPARARERLRRAFGLQIRGLAPTRDA